MPLSSYKENLLGYRIRYRRLGSVLYSEVNVTTNVTEALIIGLVPRTTYEIEVNGFNILGQGPARKVPNIETFSFGE